VELREAFARIRSETYQSLKELLAATQADCFKVASLVSEALVRVQKAAKSEHGKSKTKAEVQLEEEDRVIRSLKDDLEGLRQDAASKTKFAGKLAASESCSC
jgi:predicted translin family RNA/ssDNA-binding protein